MIKDFIIGILIIINTLLIMYLTKKGNDKNERKNKKNK